MTGDVDAVTKEVLARLDRAHTKLALYDRLLDECSTAGSATF